ncbi:DNA polymerase phi-domain-containing protein [Xylariaceae sp. FL0804]|nr:DNA polymerase phi-domain-containing protein [Xylariaceae sp. FL0804]
MGGKRKRGAPKPGSSATQPNQKRPRPEDPAAVEPKPTSLQIDKSSFTEDTTGENRKREAKIYGLLGSADGDERIAAAEALITGLLASTESVLERHLDKRLFRGLASSRNASRLGFSLVLAEILGQLFGLKDLVATKYSGLTFEKVLNILVENTKSGPNVPGQEERDFLFGRLFGLQCFVDAKVLFNEEARWPKVLDLLLQMAHKKSWIRSHCAWVIVESLPQMGQARAEDTLQKLSEIGLGKTAEGVGIWLRAQSCYPNLKMPTKPWKDPLSPGTLPEVARVLKENVAQDTGEDAAIAKIKQSNWTAQLHFVWDLILSNFLGRVEADRKNTKDQLKLFWTTVIDDGLFSKNASDGQKFRGFMIFQRYLPGLVSKDKSLASALFTRNFMKCLINQAAKEDRYLHRAAMRSLQSMEKTVESSPEILTTILQELIGKFGVYDFDQRTNTKTVENLLQWATSSNAKKVLKLLREPVVTVKETNEAEKFRQAYADYLFRLATGTKASPETADDDDSKGTLETGIKELASCAYSTQEEFAPSLSDKIREVFRRRLASAFAKANKQKENTLYLCNAVVSLNPTAVTMSDEIEAERKAALKALSKLIKSSNKVDAPHDGASSGLALLFAATLLQLYDGAPDAINILQDLQGCTKKMKSKESGTSELLVEILLALVSRQSQMMRQTSEQVFEAFTSQISSEALTLLTEPLLAEENSRGYQALFENADDEDLDMDDAEESGVESGGDEEDEVSEIGSDVEFVTLNGAEAFMDGENEDEDEDEDEDDEKSKAEAQELANLDEALSKVLKSHRLDKDGEAESSDDDSDMTDSEMMELDDKLVEVFKQRAKTTSNKKDKKDEKELVVAFKHRVLDLLHIYARNETSNVLAFGILTPLLELVRTTTAKPLANKAMGILTEFSKASKKVRSRETHVEGDALLKLLVTIHQEASRDMSHVFAKAASTASLLVASSLFAADKDNASRINEVYAQTFSDCQTGKVRMQAAFFSDWVNWGMGQASNTSDAQP